MGKRTLAEIGTFTQTALSFLTGSLVVLVIILLTGRPIFAGVAAHPAMVLYAGIFVTGPGYLTYFLAIRYSNAATGSLTFFVKPAIAPFIAMLVLHESILWNTVLGILLLPGASAVTMAKPFGNINKD